MKKRDLIITILTLANILHLILKYIEWDLLYKFELYPVYTQSIEEELIIIKKAQVSSGNL